MPVTVRRLKSGKYRVSTPGGVKARATTKARAQAQARLLRAVEAARPDRDVQGWVPTGRDKRIAKAKKRRR